MSKIKKRKFTFKIPPACLLVVMTAIYLNLAEVLLRSFKTAVLILSWKEWKISLFLEKWLQQESRAIDQIVRLNNK